MECCKNLLDMFPKFNFGVGLTQFMLFNVNLVFAAAGTLLLTMAYAAHLVSLRYTIFLQLEHFNPTIVLTTFGVVMLVVSLFGGVASIKRTAVIVHIYIEILILLLIVEMIAAVTTSVANEKIHSSIESNLVKTLRDNQTGELWNDMLDRWDFMQDNLLCCGVHSSKDWAAVDVDGSEIWENDGSLYTVPISCCEKLVDSCQSNLKCNGVHSEGCLTVWSRYVSYSISCIWCIIVVTIVAELLGLVFAFSLLENIRLLKTVEETQQQNIQNLIYTDLHKSSEETPLLGSS